MSTSQLLLPIHLIKKIFRSQEEVVDLAALLVTLGGVVDSQLGLLGEELADVWHGEDNLLHGAIQSHNLYTATPEARGQTHTVIHACTLASALLLRQLLRNTFASVI